MVILIAIATCGATLLGGLAALRLKDNLHLILGFSAGAVVGVAFFDLMPEALQLTGSSYPISLVVSYIALGFVLYLIIDRFIELHSHAGEHHHMHSKSGVLGAGSLSFHSFLDGVGIGLSFKVSTAIGIIVALAVIAHDFSDGINTVSMILRGGGARRRALSWLIADALAPVLGVVITLFFTISEASLGILLALFSGFFLYIGASDLLPESQHEHPVYWTTLSSVLGIAFLYAVVHLAG